MSSSFSMYARGLLLRAVFTPDLYVAPVALEVALTSTVPPNNAAASQLNEPTAPGYARQPYALDGTHWAPTNFGELYNTLRIQFPIVSDASWGNIAGWALIDTGSGQCLNTGSIMGPYEAIIGSIPYLDPGTVLLGIYD